MLGHGLLNMRVFSIFNSMIPLLVHELLFFLHESIFSLLKFNLLLELYLLEFSIHMLSLPTLIEIMLMVIRVQ